MKKKNRILTKGPVTKTLINLTIPMIFGMLSMVIFNMVDTYYVGKLGTDQIAALAFTFPIIMTISSLAQGIGVGVSAVISKAVGEGKRHKIRRYATDSLILGVLIVAIFVILGLLTIEPLFTLLGANGDTLPYIKEYMEIWYIGVIFVVIPMIGNNIIRALGDTKTPSIVMTIAAVINIILDPILIFGFSFIKPLGVSGAALATLISRAITLIVALIILIKREKLITFERIYIKELLHSWKEILFIGLPDALGKMIIPLGAGVITGIVATFGKEAVAAYGIGTRLDMFALMIINALASVIIPFVGQNIGAGEIDRAKKGVKVSEGFVLVYGVLVAVLFIFTGRFFASIFTSSSVVIGYVETYLKIVTISYGATGILLISTAILNVLKKPITATLLTVLRLFLINIPLAFIGSYFFGIVGTFVSIAVSFIIIALPAHLIMKKKLLNYRLDNAA